MLFPSDNEHFNSIKVRLKPGRFLLPFAALSNFNSIKVRLKPEGETAQVPSINISIP